MGKLVRYMLAVALATQVIAMPERAHANDTGALIGGLIAGFAAGAIVATIANQNQARVRAYSELDVGQEIAFEQDGRRGRYYVEADGYYRHYDDDSGRWRDYRHVKCKQVRYVPYHESRYRYDYDDGYEYDDQPVQRWCYYPNSRRWVNVSDRPQFFVSINLAPRRFRMPPPSYQWREPVLVARRPVVIEHRPVYTGPVYGGPAYRPLPPGGVNAPGMIVPQQQFRPPAMINPNTPPAVIGPGGAVLVR